jgi:hypothetical protein
LCLPALSKLEFFSLPLRKIAQKFFSHPFLLPPYPFSRDLKEEDRKDEVTKVNEERSSEEEDEDGGEKYTEKVIRKRMEKKEGVRQ